MMDKSQEEFYDNFREMFATKGWKQLSEIFLENINNISIETLKDAKDLHLAQGKLDVLKNLYRLPQTLRAQEEYVEEQDAETV
jgi:hypothetical protein